MKIVALIAILFALATSQPHPRCSSPKQWEGIGVVLNPGISTFGDAVISYDFTNQKFRNLATITTFNSSKPTTEQFDFILDYHEKILYSIYLESKTCQKSPLSGSLPPIAVPATAYYVAEFWIGVEGLVGAGVQTELWMGTTPGTYAGLWAQDGCFPIMHTSNFGISHLANFTYTTLYNITLGIKDPSVFTPPSYCK